MTFPLSLVKSEEYIGPQIDFILLNVIWFCAQKDSLLIAIREDYVDGVDCLLRFEEETHQAGNPEI